MPNESINITRDQIEDITADVTKNVLARLGFDVDDPKEMRKDMAHLRLWRVSVQKVSVVGWGTAIATVVSGVIAAAWLGFNQMFNTN